MVHKTLIFASGFSFGNTCQIVQTAIVSNLFSAVKILSSPQTQNINRHLVSMFNAKNTDFSLQSIPLNDFINNPADFLSTSEELNFLIGPSTVENQLETFAALCAINPPRMWSVFEKRTKSGISTREFRSFDVKDSVALVEISSDEIHRMLPSPVSSLLREHGIQWESSTSRFNYHINFDSMKGNTPHRQRKWEQKQYATINQLREHLGIHGLIITHSPLPNHWQKQDGTLRRLSARQIREVSK